MNGTNKSTRNWIIAGAIIVIAIVAVLGLFYPRPQGGQVAGTIGGVQKAERYRSEQITDKDVILNHPEVQALLQNDQIQKLINSKEFQALAASKAYQELAVNKAYQEMAASKA